jgi:hypothetical protein
MLTTLLLGFALGLRHATDVDHIVAVAGLLDRSATRTPRAAATLGALWGLGHMTAVLIAGGIVIALRVAIPAWLEWLLELAVAFVLVGLGARILLNCFRGRYHFHRHTHGPLPHSHLHFHQQGMPPYDHSSHLHVRPLGAAWLRNRTPVLLGAVHGLAGSAALALLVLATIPSRLFGALYLLAFGSGALLGMAAFSAILSWPLARAGRSDTWLTRVRFAAGAANAALGAFFIYRAVQPSSWPF